jgi:4-amino-4-deoxy-L-arabinose transferase-like glycosyltransferase
VAYRVNLASAVFGGLAVVALFLIGLALNGRIVAAAVGALAFGTSELFWSQAIIAEVYTLNALFVVLVVLVLLVWKERREDKHLLAAAFLMGLSMTHHMSSGLLLPAGFLFVLLVEPRKLVEWRLLLKGVGLFFLGLVPYVFLPVRAVWTHR